MDIISILIPVAIVGAIGLIAGVGLSVASKLMAVPVDEKQEKVREALPGANCGACGYSGCDGYAAAVAAGEAEPNKCTPGGEATAKNLAEILGVEVVTDKKVAFIACQGDCDITKTKYDYTGLKSCAAASLIYGGPLECKFGCIGFGDCAAACPFGAITVENGKATVCKELCIGCGICVKTCPKGLISLIAAQHKTLVLCSNKQKGAAVVKACGVSCIACGMCERACEKGAIKIIDNLPVIDGELCDNCGKCIAACKRKVLI